MGCLLGALLSVAQLSCAQNTPIRPHGRLPVAAFYDVPADMRSATPGTLIRSEEFDSYTLPYGTTATRILYHSISGRGADAAVSAVVIVPAGPPPAGGWPIIAWAHGFRGIARDCAPSLLEDLGEQSYFSMLLNLGYAVVATDYAGLGTNSRFAYFDLKSNAADVVNAIAAARSAVSNLGKQWMVMGDDEGGSVSVAVGERERNSNDAGFLGSVALGGVMDGRGIAGRLTQTFPARLIYVAAGISSVYPQFSARDILVNSALPFYEAAGKSCESNSQLPALEIAQVLKPGWEQNRYAREYFAANTLGQVRMSQPLLVLASESDALLPVAMTAQTVARLCKQGDHVLFYKYDDRSSHALLGDSVRDQLSWIQERFSGKMPAENCE
ncbi:MAG TPA: lipase family protein [Candidatus Eisenbacteria bacterium]|nr:lipase family protein [Candidatus Eisenbacteria bacterium]